MVSIILRPGHTAALACARLELTFGRCAAVTQLTVRSAALWMPVLGLLLGDELGSALQDFVFVSFVCRQGLNQPHDGCSFAESCVVSCRKHGAKLEPLIPLAVGKLMNHALECRHVFERRSTHVPKIERPSRTGQRLAARPQSVAARQ